MKTKMDDEKILNTQHRFKIKFTIIEVISILSWLFKK